MLIRSKWSKKKNEIILIIIPDHVIQDRLSSYFYLALGVHTLRSGWSCDCSGKPRDTHVGKIR